MDVALVFKQLPAERGARVQDELGLLMDSTQQHHRAEALASSALKLHSTASLASIEVS
jgi:hypothetical protein